MKFKLNMYLPKKSKLYLVKNGSIWADETPLEHLFGAIGVHDRVTNMENLALVGYVSIITIGPCITSKFINNVFPN